MPGTKRQFTEGLLQLTCDVTGIADDICNLLE